MKHKITLIAAFIALAFVGTAQTTDKPIILDKRKVTVSVLNLTDFPNGYRGINNNYLVSNLYIPLPSLKAAPTGHYDNY